MKTRTQISDILPGAHCTIDVDGRPTIVIHVERFAQAQELLREQWLRDDLCQLMSNGIPLCTDGSKLTARYATEDERAAFERDAIMADPTADEVVITYLVALDGIPGRWRAY
jgi:hypothetical protein